MDTAKVTTAVCCFLQACLPDFVLTGSELKPDISAPRPTPLDFAFPIPTHI